MRTYIANRKYLVSSDSELKNVKLLVIPKDRELALIKLGDKKGERFFSIIKQHRSLKKALQMWPKFAKGIGLKQSDFQYTVQKAGNYIVDVNKNVYVYQINSKKQVEILPVAEFCHTLSMITDPADGKEIVVEELGYLQTTKDFVKSEELDNQNNKVIKIQQKISRKNANVVKIFKENTLAEVEYPEDIELKYDYTLGDIDKYSDDNKKMLK